MMTMMTMIMMMMMMMMNDRVGPGCPNDVVGPDAKTTSTHPDQPHEGGGGGGDGRGGKETNITFTKG